MELLLTVEQAAERLHLQPNTVRQHLSRGLLRGIKRGRQWRIPASALMEDARVTTKATAPRDENPSARAVAMVEERDARSTTEIQASFARALELVAQLEKEMEDSPRRARGKFDAAATIREMREAQTP